MVLIFIYKSSKELESKMILKISKLERSYLNTENHHTPLRTVIKNYILLLQNRSCEILDKDILNKIVCVINFLKNKLKCFVIL